MPRTRTVEYVALNIRTHPHSTEKYVSLFEALFDLKRAINLRGDSHGIMTEVEPIGDHAVDGMIGEIAKFTKIEPGRWFNMKTLKAAEEKDTRKIQVPDELRPNYAGFRFVFFPKKHYLVMESKDRLGRIGPNTIYTYFRRICDLDSIKDKFGTVEITLAPEAEQLDSILGMPTLKQLELVIRKPNADDLEKLEGEILERLKKQKVAEERIILKADSGSSIAADEQTKRLCRVAQLNGEVSGRGYRDDGKLHEESTLKHPLVEIGSYVSGEVSPRDFMIQMAGRVVRKIQAMKKTNG